MCWESAFKFIDSLKGTFFTLGVCVWKKHWLFQFWTFCEHFGPNSHLKKSYGVFLGTDGRQTHSIIKCTWNSWMQQKGVFSTLQLFTCTVLTCSLFPACCYWIIVAASITQWLLGVFRCCQLSHKEHTWQGRDILQRYAKLSVSLNSLWDYPSKKALKTKAHRGSRGNMHQSMQSAFRPAQALALSKAGHPTHTCPQTYILIVSYTGLLNLVSFWTPSADLYREIHPQTPHPSWVYLWGAGPILPLDLPNHRIIQAWITLEVSSPTSCSK